MDSASKLIPARVGIIGGGLAGPVIATLLKLKGYNPVIFERRETVAEGGIGIGVQRNGLEVLQRIPGLVESLPGLPLDYFHFYSVVPEDKCVLAELDGPKRRREAAGGLGTIGMRRSALQGVLVAAAERTGVPIRWRHRLSTLEQREADVLLTFGDGTQEPVGFVVGCDGLHSDTRKALFGEQPANYTGLAQTGGYSPMPAHLRGTSTAMTVFGDGAHLFAIPVDEDGMGWAITTREAEAKEMWRTMDADAAEAFKQTSPVAHWDYGVGELVQNATMVTKYGLYDRPELPAWHKGRVVLIGDAAHPTSPFLGQGANQAFEDAALLVDLLEQHCPGARGLDTAALDIVFRELAAARVPRTSELVRRSREHGESRVVHGAEACIARNNSYRKLLADETLMRQRFGA